MNSVLTVEVVCLRRMAWSLLGNADTLSVQKDNLSNFFPIMPNFPWPAGPVTQITLPFSWVAFFTCLPRQLYLFLPSHSAFTTLGPKYHIRLMTPQFLSLSKFPWTPDLHIQPPTWHSHHMDIFSLTCPNQIPDLSYSRAFLKAGHLHESRGLIHILDSFLTPYFLPIQCPIHEQTQMTLHWKQILNPITKMALV